MKKALVVLLVSLMVGVFAFAEDPAPAAMSFGAWGRVGYTFAQSTSAAGAVVTTTQFPNWGGMGRVGFNVHGNSANVGFDLNVDSNGGTIGIGDNARVWVKLFDVIKVELGKAQIDALRGKIGDSGNIGVKSFGDEDSIFKRFYPQHGFALELTPVEGLFIAAALDTGALDSTGAATAAADFGAIQVGAGYTIKDVGQIRVQYIGSGYADKSTVAYTAVIDPATGMGTKVTTAVFAKQPSWIQAAFALTAVAGLTVDLGAKINISDVKAKTAILLGAAYGADALSLKTRLALNVGDDGANTDTEFGWFLDGSYTIAAPVALGAQVSLDATVKDMTNLDLFPYIQFGYGNGFLKVGFEYKADLRNTSTMGVAINSWSIPVVAEYWF